MDVSAPVLSIRNVSEVALSVHLDLESGAGDVKYRIDAILRYLLDVDVAVAVAERDVLVDAFRNLGRSRGLRSLRWLSGQASYTQATRLWESIEAELRCEFELLDAELARLAGKSASPWVAS